MKIITLNRIVSSDEGSLGLLHMNGKPLAVTLDKSKAFNYPHYILENVPNRSFIKIHVANYPSELYGCIGVGSYFANGAIAVSKSRNAMDHVMWALDRHEKLALNIRSEYFTPYSNKAPNKLEPATGENE